MKLVRHALWTLLCAVFVAGVAGGMWAHHDGYRAYAVRTGSMTPTYPTGAVVVDRPLASPPTVGEVITFHPHGDAGVVTHRVAALSGGKIRTKGDANRAMDVSAVRADQVVGSVWGGTPRVGYLLVFLRQPAGLASLVMAMLSLIMLWQLCFGTTSSASAPPESAECAEEALVGGAAAAA